MLEAADQQLVVPNGLANVEGNSSMADPFNSTSFRFQQVFDASQFAFLGSGTARIDQISFRIDGASTSDVILFFGDGSVTLSTTQKKPDSLSPVFADNRGLDAVTVFNNALSFGGLRQPSTAPYDFHATLGGTTPFYYSPSQGNLLIEIAGVAGQPFLPGALDAQFDTGDSLSRVFATSNLAPSGTADSLGLVTEFDIAVIPEPATLAIITLGMSAIFGAWFLKGPSTPLPISNKPSRNHIIERLYRRTYMKTRISHLWLIFCGSASLLQAADQVVVPNGLANIEGNSSLSEPFNWASFRFQQVFDASQFAFPLRHNALVGGADGDEAQETGFVGGDVDGAACDL